MEAEKPQKVILLAPFIVPRALRRQSTRQCRVLRFATPVSGDKRRARAAETSPIEGPRFRPVNQHLWEKPMINLQSLRARIRHLRDRSTTRIIKLEAIVAQAKQEHLQLVSIDAVLQTELSRLHEQQPEV